MDFHAYILSILSQKISLRTHSLYAPYIDQDLQNRCVHPEVFVCYIVSHLHVVLNHRWWDFGGDAYVNTNKHVRLTRPVPSQMVSFHVPIFQMSLKSADDLDHFHI